MTERELHVEVDHAMKAQMMSQGLNSPPKNPVIPKQGTPNEEPTNPVTPKQGKTNEESEKEKSRKEDSTKSKFFGFGKNISTTLKRMPPNARGKNRGRGGRNNPISNDRLTKVRNQKYYSQKKLPGSRRRSQNSRGGKSASNTTNASGSNNGQKKQVKLPILEDCFFNDENIGKCETIQAVATHIFKQYEGIVKAISGQVLKDIANMKKYTAKNKKKAQELLQKANNASNLVVKNAILSKIFLSTNCDTTANTATSDSNSTNNAKKSKKKNAVFFKAAAEKARINYKKKLYSAAIFNANQAMKVQYAPSLSLLIFNANMNLARQCVETKKPNPERATMFIKRAESESYKYKFAVCQKDDNEQLNPNNVDTRIHQFKTKYLKEGEPKTREQKIDSKVLVNNLFDRLKIENDCIVTTEEIKKGKPVFSERALILVPFVPMNYCGNCCRRITVTGIPCENCSEVMYCSETCHVLANMEWHHRICQYSARMFRPCGKIGLMAFLVLARCDIKYLVANASKNVAEIYNGYSGIDYYQMAYNHMLISTLRNKINFKWKSICLLLCKALRMAIVIQTKFLEKGQPMVSKADLPNLFIVCFRTVYALAHHPTTLNTLKIKEQKQTLEMGSGVGPFGFCLTVGCEGNVNYKLKPSGVIQYRAIRDIGKGERVFLSSGVDPTLKKKARQNFLRHNYNLISRCQCCLCTDGKSKIVSRVNKNKVSNTDEIDKEIQNMVSKASQQEFAI